MGDPNSTIAIDNTNTLQTDDHKNIPPIPGPPNSLDRMKSRIDRHARKKLKRQGISSDYTDDEGESIKVKPKKLKDDIDSSDSETEDLEMEDDDDLELAMIKILNGDKMKQMVIDFTKDYVNVALSEFAKTMDSKMKREIDHLLGEISKRDTNYDILKSEVETLKLQMEQFLITGTVTLTDDTSVKKDIVDLKTKVQNMEKNQIDTVKKVEENKNDHEELAMYTRRNSVLIFNYRDPYDYNENCVSKAFHVFNDIQGLRLLNADIGRAHRLGPLKTNSENARNRPIIVKLIRHDAKDLILNNQERLNGTGLSIRENVTRYRKSLIDAARDIIGTASSVWSYDGRVTALFAGRKYQIVNDSDIDKLKNLVHDTRARRQRVNANNNG